MIIPPSFSAWVVIGFDRKKLLSFLEIFFEVDKSPRRHEGTGRSCAWEVSERMTYDQIMKEYEISREDILAVLDYAAKTLAHEEIRAVHFPNPFEKGLRDFCAKLS
jgi:hypothetical protein